MLRFITRAPSMSAFLGATALIAASLLPLPAQAGSFTFTPYPTPRPLPLAKVTFENAQGKLMNLAEFKGKVVLLNIWATWCPPCVEEMPTLNKLQTLLGGKEFAVVPLSIDKGGIFTVKSFYQDNFIDHLPIYVDATTHAVDTLDILGTPTTILIDKQGREVARTLGPQNWDKPDVIAQIRHYMAMPGPAPSKPGTHAKTGALMHTAAEVVRPAAASR